MTHYKRQQLTTLRAELTKLDLIDRVRINDPLHNYLDELVLPASCAALSVQGCEGELSTSCGNGRLLYSIPCVSECDGDKDKYWRRKDKFGVSVRHDDHHDTWLELVKIC